MHIKDQHCLESILDAINRIQEYTANFNSADSLNNDYKSFDATMMNFIVIGEMIDRLSENLKSSHDTIDWVRIKDFRNILAHDYFGIDAEEVWQIINNDMAGLKLEINKILTMNSQ
jgi:uncharacterized protein with HEPN domain